MDCNKWTECCIILWWMAKRSPASFRRTIKAHNVFKKKDHRMNGMYKFVQRWQQEPGRVLVVERQLCLSSCSLRAMVRAGTWQVILFLPYLQLKQPFLPEGGSASPQHAPGPECQQGSHTMGSKLWVILPSLEGNPVHRKHPLWMLQSSGSIGETFL